MRRNSRKINTNEFVGKNVFDCVCIINVYNGKLLLKRLDFSYFR